MCPELNKSEIKAVTLTLLCSLQMTFQCLRLKPLQMEAKELFDQLCQQVQLEEGSKERAWNVWESVSTKVVETTQVQMH